MTPPMAPLSAPFDTRQRAEQFAQLARRDGCTDVAIVTTFKQLDPQTGKFLKVKFVPASIAAMAQG